MLTSHQNLHRFYGEEKAVMDLEWKGSDWRSVPTSSYDAGVATSADGNFDEFNQMKERFLGEGWTMSAYYEAGVATSVNDGKCFPVTDCEASSDSDFDAELELCCIQGKRIKRADLDGEAYDWSMPASTHDGAVVARDDGIEEGWTISSNYDAGVGTGVNDHKCSPARKEPFYWSASSHDGTVGLSGDVSNMDKPNKMAIENGWTNSTNFKQERYEDASSMSFVDYRYSEEDYDQSGEDEVDYDVEEDNDPISKLVGKDFVDSLRAKYEKRPSLEVWVNSWKVQNYERSFACVNVYAYYNSKDKSYGGYGVVLRDSLAKPITASAKFSAVGKSFFTQVLMGIKAGLTLAGNYGRHPILVECNSIKIACHVDQLWNCRNVKCRTSGATCEWCMSYFTRARGCDPSLVPLLREIKALAGQNSQGLLTSPRNLNRAARYVAKMGKKNRPKLEEPAEINPVEFPQELKRILWKDAFGLRSYNNDGGY